MTIEKIRLACLKFGIITVQDLERYTALELIYVLLNKLNEVIDGFNSIDEQMKEVILEQLNQWLIDGTLEELINETALKNINDKVDQLMTTPKKFGAVGDGVTDDAKAIQDFLDYCSLHHSIGRIPSGVYLLGSQLTIKSNTTLFFDKGAEFKQTHGNTMINIMNKNHVKYKGYQQIHIYNGTFNCDGVNNLSPMNCFFIQHASDVIFENCVFKNVRSYHALDINGSKDIQVRNCKFLNSFDDTKKADREAIQIDIASAVLGETDLCWDETPTINITIENCYFGRDDLNTIPYTSAIGSHNAKYDKYFENIVIRNNVIEDCSKYAVHGWKWEQSIIEENTMINCGGGVLIENPHRDAKSCHELNGVYKGMQPTKNHVIKNNTIISPKNAGVFIRGKYITTPDDGEGSDGTISQCLKTGNKIETTNNYSSIILLNTKQSSVLNNIVNGGADGIRIYSCEHIQVKDNQIYAANNYGISMSTTTLTGTDGLAMCEQMNVVGNIIEKSNECGIFMLGGSGIIANNILNKCNFSGNTAKSIIDISSGSHDVSIISNQLTNHNLFKNLIFVTNTCSRVMVTQNLSDFVKENKIFYASTNGLTDNNL